MASLLPCRKLLEGLETDGLFLVLRVEASTPWPSRPSRLPLCYSDSVSAVAGLDSYT